MKIVPGDRPDQLRCENPATSMLVGLLQKVPDGRWRIELFMKVDGTASTKEEAVAFARGCWAMAEAYSLFKKPTPPLVQAPQVQDHRGIHDVITGGGKHARPSQTKG